jgi:hypothetical protein
MANNEQGRPYKYIIWVNLAILAIFLGVRFGVSPLLGWQIDTAYTIVWFTLFVAVFILVNYFLYFRPYLRWKKSAKTAFRT